MFLAQQALKRITATAVALVTLAASVPSRADDDDPASCIAASEDGQKLRNAGQYLRARTSFTACAHEACPAQIRGDCLGWLDDLDKKMPTVVLSARDSGTDVSDVGVAVDGVPLATHLDGRPVSLDPGEHKFHFVRGNEKPFDVVAVLRAGDKNRAIAAKFGADPILVTPGPPPLAYVLTGVAVVGVGAFAVLGLAGKHQIDECTGGNVCADRSGHETASVRDFVIGDSALVVGLAAGAVATWLFLKRREPVLVYPDAAAALVPLKSGAAASVSFRF